MTAHAAASDCEYQDQHPRIDERLTQLESRARANDGLIAELGKGQAGIREEIAGMRGELRGALWASKMSGSVIGALVTSAVALLVAFIKRGG